MHPLGRLPPGDGVCKEIICHVSRQVGVVGLVGVAFAAAGLPTARGEVVEQVLVWVEAVELCAVLATRGGGHWGPSCGEVPHGRVAGMAMAAEGSWPCGI